MFEDRLDVGRQLGEKLKSIVSGKGLVLGIPRGGMVVADEVAKILKWPLGVCVTKKIGLPGQEELAVGAMGLDGIVVWDKKLLKVLGLKEDDLRQQVEITRKKIDRLFEKVRPSRQATRSDLAKKAVVLVDDGIATGQTVEAAIKWLRMISTCWSPGLAATNPSISPDAGAASPSLSSLAKIVTGPSNNAPGNITSACPKVNE